MTSVTIVGNLTASPELAFTPAGAARATFTVAVTQRTKQGTEWVDGEPMFLRVTAWRELAEHIGESLDKGQRVIVQGALKMRSYDKDGDKRQSWEVTAEEVGPSLRWATAKPERAVNTSQRVPAASTAAPVANDPWTASDSAPF